MMITENGIATSNDSKREWYMRNHLAAIGRAIRDGYDVRGYFAWSLADNYEWHYGYKATFGLAKMDPATKDRILKPSAEKIRGDHPLASHGGLDRRHPAPKKIPAPFRATLNRCRRNQVCGRILPDCSSPLCGNPIAPEQPWSSKTTPG